MREDIFKSLQRSWAQFLYCNKQTVIEWKCLLCKQLSSRVLIQNWAELVPCFPATKHGLQSPDNFTNMMTMNNKAYLCQPQVLLKQLAPKCLSSNAIFEKKIQWMKHSWSSLRQKLAKQYSFLTFRCRSLLSCMPTSESLFTRCVFSISISSSLVSQFFRILLILCPQQARRAVYFGSVIDCNGSL